MRIKRVSAFLLSFLLFFAFSVSVFAVKSSAANYREYKTYVSLGDSIAAGGSLNEKKTIAGYRGRTGTIQNTYPALLKSALCIKSDDPADYENFNRNVKPIATQEELNYTGPVDGYANYSFFGARGAMSTHEMRALLDETYEPGKNTDNWFNFMGYEKDREWIEIHRKQYRSAVQNADLITIQFGANDLVGTVMSLLNEYHLLDGVSQINDLAGIFAGGTPAESIVKIIKLLPKAMGVIKDLPSAFRNGIEELKTNWDAILAMIFELNPDVQVVAVGLYAPDFNAVANSFGIDLTPALNKAIKILNNIFRDIFNDLNDFLQNKCTYRDRYLYADISGLTAYVAEQPEIEFLDGMHPDAGSNQWITEQILAVLPTHPHSLTYVDNNEGGYWICDDQNCPYFGQYYGDASGRSWLSVPDQNIVENQKAGISSEPLVYQSNNAFTGLTPDVTVEMIVLCVIALFIAFSGLFIFRRQK